jgi:Cu(I)/Ag(I) efflux system periplasmic protein CusF
MKTMLRHILVVCALASAPLAWAQTTDHSHRAASNAQAAPSAEMAEGEVRRVDPDTGKVTLKHGPIKSLDMPPMTMVFNADKALLAPLKVGDKVRFKVVHEGGKYTVTSIQPSP